MKPPPRAKPLSDAGGNVCIHGSLQSLSQGKAVDMEIKVPDMVPHLRPGDHVQVRPVPAGSLHPHDIVLCRLDGSAAFRRVAGLRYQLKAIFVDVTSPATGGTVAHVRADDVLGKVTRVVRQGKLVPARSSAMAEITHQLSETLRLHFSAPWG